LGADPSRLAADRLAEVLVRVHPSFRFEERLARRLADLAAAIGPARPPNDEPLVPEATPRVAPPLVPEATPPLVPEPQPRLAPEGPVGAGPIGSTAPTPLVRTGRFPLAAVPLRNPIVIGGAITSAAISIAGVALVAWRRSRPRRPVARAVSLAHTGFGAASLGDRPPRVGRRRGRTPALLAGLALRAARPGTDGASVQGRT
jgi:hypothetical protein